MHPSNSNASHKIAYILEGAMKEFRGFEAILFVDISYALCL
jgi:hypothetical protein